MASKRFPNNGPQGENGHLNHTARVNENGMGNFWNTFISEEPDVKSLSSNPSHEGIKQDREPGKERTEEKREHERDYSNRAQVQIDKKIYLIEEQKEEKDYVEIHQVFDGEKVQIRIIAVNHDTCPLVCFRIGDMAERGYNMMPASVQVYKGKTKLTANKDYHIIIPSFEDKPEGYDEFDILVELNEEVLKGDRILLSIDALINAPGTVQSIDNVGAATFRRKGNPRTEIVMTHRVPLCIICPVISIRKSGIPLAVAIGEHIEYTLLVTNTGNTPLTNVMLYDTAITDYLKAGNLAFDEANPIKIDGMDAGNTLPINIGDIPIFGNKTITIRALVRRAPAGGRFINSSYILADPISMERPCVEEENDKFTPRANSNTVTIDILDVKVDITKTADKVEAEDGDEIEYTIRVTNQSNRVLSDVTVYDVLDEETNFIPNSVRVDGTLVPGANIRTGVNIGGLGADGSQTPPLDSKTITYRARVDLNNNANLTQQLENRAYATYTYRRMSGSNPESGKTAEVVYPVKVARPSLNVFKSQNLQYVEVGDSISYVITLNNNGNKAFNSIRVTDSIPNGLQQIVDVQTTNIDGSIIYNNFTGISLGTGIEVVGTTTNKASLEAGESMLVRFTTRVNNVPPETFTNRATVCYAYQIQAQGGNETRQDCEDTNAVTATGIIQNLSVVKTVTPTSVVQGETAVYTLTVMNTGTTAIQNVRLTDPLDPALVLTRDYTLVGGVQVFERITDPDGVTIPEISQMGTILVQFEVRYTTVPPTQVNNITNYDYYYIKDPRQDPVLVADNQSNQATLIAGTAAADLQIVKSSLDQTVLDQGIVTYNLRITNSGNRDLLGIVLRDALPEGMTFVSESVTLNHILLAGGNITTGILLGDLSANSAPIFVSFQAKATNAPASGIFDNVASATFNYRVGETLVGGSATSNVYRITLGRIDLIRTQSQGTAQVGSQVNHTLIVTNTGNSPLNSLLLADMVDPRLTVDPGTIRVDGMNTGGSLNSVVLPDLAPGQATFVTYTGTVNSAGDGSALVNTANVNGNTVDIKTVTDTASISTAIVAAVTPNLFALKTVNTATASIGDILMYQIIVSNQGSLALSNIILQDTLNSCLALIPNTLTINGVLSTGSLQNLTLPDLEVGSSAIVVDFSAKVVCTTTDNLITNIAGISFTDPSGVSQTVQTNQVQTLIVDGCQCFFLPIEIIIPGYNVWISNINNISTQLVSVVPVTNGPQAVITVNYAVQIEYQDAWGQTQSYVSSASVNVQLASEYNNNTIVLSTEDMIICKSNKVSGKLIIRVC